MSASNSFLIINLGCEMLYVIEQRLKAQNIAPEKSVQVLQDLTNVLLDPKLILQLINPHPSQILLTPQQCRILLTDIACCSLMRLDMTSMDKLWDLMLMVFKWQLYLIRQSPNRLLELTCRHMDGIASLMPDTNKTFLIDNTKRILLEFWDNCTEDDKNDFLVKLMHWVRPYNIKISILIRLSFQRNDGTFELEPNRMYMDLFNDFIENVGENIYAKTKNIKTKPEMIEGNESRRESRSVDITNELNSFASQLNIVETEANDDEKNGIKTSTTEASNDNILLLDEVNYSLANDVEIENNDMKNIKENDQQSEVFHLLKTKTTLQDYLEQFAMENKQESGESTQTFDPTAELLKMLDDGKEK